MVVCFWWLNWHLHDYRILFRWEGELDFSRQIAVWMRALNGKVLSFLVTYKFSSVIGTFTSKSTYLEQRDLFNGLERLAQSLLHFYISNSKLNGKVTLHIIVSDDTRNFPSRLTSLHIRKEHSTSSRHVAYLLQGCSLTSVLRISGTRIVLILLSSKRTFLHIIVLDCWFKRIVWEIRFSKSSSLICL